MRRQVSILTIILVLNFLACSRSVGQSKNNRIDKDTTFNIFGDKAYFLSFKIIQEKKDDDPHFGTLTLTHKINGKTDVLLKDTVEFFMPLLQLKDFNNDQTNDILILNTSSTRSVWTHHLYLVDNKNHKLIPVKNFEELYNPEFDSKNNIIISTAIYSKIFYSFYRIGTDNKLINLGHGFEGDMTEADDAKYKNAIKSITEKD
ncbi:hypothetical protein NF867_03975 [Solitalea sp. MAHUQ-68]|uniref:Uncharacterized protein n=2 Tax=Sphingobacteriaceae TaxID=84566 RepID=A0A9X2EZP5_9SPHI|nr:hypothetical protein [Solitalea agri]